MRPISLLTVLVLATACGDKAPQASTEPAPEPTAEDNACAEQLFFADADGDGHGNALSSISACEAPAGFVTDDTDCDDTDDAVAPGSHEVCDGLDNDCDGTVDEELVTTWRYDYGWGIETLVYDADQLVTERSLDTDGDGSVDYRETHEYDTEGRRVRTTLDYDADGSANAIHTTAYDSKGRAVRFGRDTDANGTEDTATTLVFDGRGNHVHTETDDGVDGTPEAWTTRIYDGNDQLIVLHAQFIDRPGYRIEHTYDEDGFEVERTSDYGEDGTIDDRMVWDWSDDHLAYTLEAWRTNSVEPSSRNTTTLNADGNLLTDEYDHDADGIIDSRREIFYDDQGRRIREITIEPPSPTQRTWWTYADNGTVITERDNDGDSMVDSIQEARHDEHERLMREATDVDADGTWEREIEPSVECIVD